MKRQILISLVVLLSVSGFAGAVNLPWADFHNFSQDRSEVYKQNELIVRFIDVEAGTQPVEGPAISGPWTRRAIRSMISDFLVAGATVDKEYDDVASGLAVIRLPEGTSVTDAFIQFNKSSNVLYAEPNYKYKLFLIPNDPNFSNLWGLDNTGQTGGTEDADIDAPEAWDIQTGKSDIIVAIADTGVDYKHPDLAANMWVNSAEQEGTPGSDDDGNGYIDDIYGYDFAGASSRIPDDDDSDPCDCFFHGTHVAGSIGAVGNNNVGIAGVTWNVKMMALKIFADDYGVEPEVFASEAVEAIGYAVDNGAKVINASWGGDSYSQSLYDAIKDAGDAGLLFVAAAGNDYGKDNDENPVYPASYDLDNIISTMSTDQDDQMSNFSNFGESSVDIGEPGTDILSTTPTYETLAMLVFGVSTNYDTLSGTSMSAPYAAGACALVWSQYPTLPNKIVKGILLKTVDPTLASPRRCLSGGRINIYNALTLIPSGKSGKVLNSKDDPGNPDNLYSTIQSAIDEASDGDVLIAEADSLFLEAIDFKGKAITLRSGDITDPNDPNISPENTLILGLLDEGPVVTFENNEGPETILKGFTVSWGNAEYGGGIRCYRASPTIKDCIISNNFATYYGAGIDCYDGSPTIESCTITDNHTSGSSGIGGGVNCEQASPLITNCTISNNFADNFGGGIACYNANPTIFNCIIANNSAIYQGGGIDLEYSSPVITNCTIVVDDPNAPKDGGIFANVGSSPVITNCILWGNGDDLYLPPKIFAKHSCTEDVEDSNPNKTNIHDDPKFVTGPLGDYYLSQTTAGQLSDSPCVDAGGNPNTTDPNLRIDTYTTRTDGETDSNSIDIGAHYPPLPAKLLQLNVFVAGGGGSGYVDPNSGTYKQYQVVELTLKGYDPNYYRIRAWTGTDDDSSTEPTNTITMMRDTSVIAVLEDRPWYQLRTEVIGGRGAITPYHRRGQSYPDGTKVTLTAMPDQTYIVDRWVGTDNDTLWANENTVTIDSDKEVTVLFRQPKSLHVPGQYQSIGQAINAAHGHGDKIIVSAGSYYGGYDFMGKAITIASEHPDDPCSVAATIIYSFGYPAFIFQSGEGNDSVVDGFTIQGVGDLGPVTPLILDGMGVPGMNALGGAISCLNGSSPTLTNLVIKDVVARGQDGEDASFIYDPPEDPEDPLEPLDPLDPLPDPNVPDPNDPSMWYPEDPNGPELPDDPNAPVDGFDGQDGADGLPGEPGADGVDGEPGYPGGDGGVGYGGAMYFDANSAPTILYCKIINCQAIGGNGGFGGAGQDGQDGQAGQPGQDGQPGQNGGEGLNDGAQGAAGNGGMGGDGGVGGNGGRGGDGGKGGQGGEALGGAVYFGPNCRPTIRFCEIINCSTLQGLGNYGGDGGNGGNGGVGAALGEGADGGDGEPDGEDGEDGADSSGGNGGDGGIGGGMDINGIRSWAGAIYFGENCEIDISDTIIRDNAAKAIVPTYTYGGGDGGDGGIGGDGEGDAVGGTGGTGGDGGSGGPPVIIDPNDDTAADPNDPNGANVGPGTGGPGGAGGADGEDGEDGAGGLLITSYTMTFGGANYYDFGCKAVLNNCTISNNTSRQYDGSGQDGGGEYYQYDCTTTLNNCDLNGNLAGFDGSGGGQYFNPSCSVQINDCNYIDNSSGESGGGLFCLSDCYLDVNNSSFIGNSSVGYYSTGGAVYGGGVLDINSWKWYNNSTITIDNSYFGNNEAAFGGGLYWYGNGAEVSIYDSVISDNVAEHGGGMYWSSGAPVIAGCSIVNNKARTRWFMPDDIIYQSYYYYYLDTEKPYGGGGGIFCWSSDAKIEDSFITGNSSAGSGGGVYFGGDPSMPGLRNCLVKGNSSVLDGGGIVSYWLTAPTISNCTIVNNNVYDPDNTERGRGGGLSCSYKSQTKLIDSILWNNQAVKGSQIAIGSDYEPVYIDRPATVDVSYCDIQGGQKDVYFKPGRILNWGEGNFGEDINKHNPLFVDGKSYFFLSQEAVQGQNTNSPCINAGSDLAINLGFDEYTTRSDSVADAGQVDIGFHYPITQGKHRLIVKVIGGEHGTVTPLGGFFDNLTVVTLRARVDTGYQVRWTGTDNDSSDALTNTVTMDTNKTVTVEFTKYAGNTVTVPGSYPTIQEAVANARDGDTIVVDVGTYYGGYSGIALLVDKAVTITSRNPDDPCCVAATIIDGYMTTNQDTHIGVAFTSNANSNTVLNGLTIQNCGGNWGDGDDGDRDVNHPNGEDGSPGQGAAILIDKGASPIIKNCIIRDNLVRAGNGGNGVNAEGDDPILNAGRGGWGGWARGAGIYCGPNTSPKIINCTIENNVTRGGDAGNGGDGGGTDEGYANYGGNYSRSQAIHFDPDSALIEYVIGDLWKAWDWDYASTFGPYYDEPNLTSYIGDYRWYSAYGGGAFCDIGSNVAFVNCEIRGNRTYGGLSGVGGTISGTGRILEPVLAYELPTYGAGVYCAARSKVTFKDCTFEDNVTSEILAGVDPNHRLDPYIGYGGGVCAESSAAVEFVDCNFVDNDADSGGGLYIDKTDVAVLDCNFISNTALRGGGILGVDSIIDIISTKVINNTAAADVNDPDYGIEDILASGAGLYCWLGGVTIQDCNVSGNRADFSGGGMYLRDVNRASLINSLITNNLAGRDGGGTSANWYTDLVISNSTFVGNAAIDSIGEPNDTGLGGGLACSYGSECDVIDSIFWNNFALKGNAIAVGTGLEYDQRCSSLVITNSNIKDGQAGIWWDYGCQPLDDNWWTDNKSNDPLFVAGRRGDYYLSQSGAGQSQQSTLVDAGSDHASHVGLIAYTTRTDEIRDKGIVDMGYHRRLAEKCSFVDFYPDGDPDGVINSLDFEELAKLAAKWLDQPCNQANNWCDDADITTDGVIDADDWAFIDDCNGVADVNAPVPNPIRWETEPYLSSGTTISMVAETAFDGWGFDVEYYFENISGNNHNSGWQKSRMYTDGGLSPGVEYGYRVRARDGIKWIPNDRTGEPGNKTDWSIVAYAGSDSTPPAPAPYIETIFAPSPTSISMVATIAYDDSEVEYYFQNTSAEGHDSGWQDEPNYTDVGLDPNTEYGYRVRARDKSASQNTTTWSDTVLFTTPVPADLIPPAPDPMEWDPTVDANGFDGTPRQTSGGGGTFDYWAAMTAVVAVDAGGGPVEYFFECTTEKGFSSGWIATPTYTVLLGRSGQGHRFRVKARDQFFNETAWSTEDVAD